MIVLKSATTAKQHINAVGHSASACKHLRIRLIVIFSLLLTISRVICVKSTSELNEFRAFADFIEQQHLKHAIIAYNCDTCKTLQQQSAEHFEKHNAMRALVNITNTTLNFYNVHYASKNLKNDTNFQNLFVFAIPRVGIFVNQLEDILLQEHVLGTNNVNSTGYIQPDHHSIKNDRFLRFNNTKTWFIMSKEQSVIAALANVRRVMTPLALNISADITLGVHVESNFSDIIKLFDIYKILPDCLEIEEKGYWSPAEGIKLKKRFLQSYVTRRRNFKGLQLRGGTVIREKPDNIDDLDYLKSLNDKNRDTMQRKTFQLLTMLNHMFNVSFEINVTNTWGTNWPNGSWDGVMEMLISGQVEIAMCPMQYVTNRILFVQYTPVVHVEYLTFIFRHPRGNSIRNIFAEPFVGDVWYAIVAVIGLTTLLLLFHLRNEHRFALSQYKHFQYRLDYAILCISEAFFQQGPDTNAFASTSARMLIFFVCVFSLMLQQFYGAFIVGSLLAVTPRTITSLETLYNSSLEIGMEDIPYNLAIIGNSTTPLIHEMYTRKMCKDRKHNILTIEEGAERIKKGGFAFHVSANRMLPILKNILNDDEFCDLQQVSFISPLSGLAIGKLSPYSEYITSAILKWDATGLMQHNDQQWKLPEMDCSLNSDSEVEVDLQHFLTSIFLLAAVMLFCLGILILEIIYSKLENRLKLALFF